MNQLLCCGVFFFWYLVLPYVWIWKKCITILLMQSMNFFLPFVFINGPNIFCCRRFSENLIKNNATKYYRKFMAFLVGQNLKNQLKIKFRPTFKRIIWVSVLSHWLTIPQYQRIIESSKFCYPFDGFHNVPKHWLTPRWSSPNKPYKKWSILIGFLHMKIFYSLFFLQSQLIR